ncbi:MAG: purine-nucleoside phosphorylase, partial [Propioniciclava sp.]
MTEQPDPYALAAEAASSLTQRLGVEKLDAAIVLGSGWSTAAAGLGETLGEVSLADLPGFAAPVVAGHGGTVR